MTNKTKTIDLQDLPLTERLTVGRRLASNPGKPVLFNGLTVTNNKSAADKAAALAAMPASYRLTQARMAAPKKPEEPASARHGACLVEDADGKILGFFPGYDDE